MSVQEAEYPSSVLVLLSCKAGSGRHLRELSAVTLPVYSLSLLGHSTACHAQGSYMPHFLKRGMSLKINRKTVCLWATHLPRIALTLTSLGRVFPTSGWGYNTLEVLTPGTCRLQTSVVINPLLHLRITWRALKISITVATPPGL